MDGRVGGLHCGVGWMPGLWWGSMGGGRLARSWDCRGTIRSVWRALITMRRSVPTMSIRSAGCHRIGLICVRFVRFRSDVGGVAFRANKVAFRANKDETSTPQEFGLEGAQVSSCICLCSRHPSRRAVRCMWSISPVAFPRSGQRAGKKVIKRNTSYTEFAQSFTEQNFWRSVLRKGTKANAACAQRHLLFSVKLCVNSVYLCASLMTCLLSI